MITVHERVPWLVKSRRASVKEKDIAFKQERGRRRVTLAARGFASRNVGFSSAGSQIMPKLATSHPEGSSYDREDEQRNKK